MSHNQYRGEKSESYYRKPSGRPVNSSYQRVSSGGAGKSGGGTGLPPASSKYQSSSFSTSRSFRRSNGQGAQSRSTDAGANSEFRVVQNVAGAQFSPSGASGASVSYVPVKPTESQTQRSNQTVPRAPHSQSVSATSDSTAPTTPIRGDTSKEVSFQFGSFSPGFMNGMQIPARTSSAPPNLDEQKRDQARYDIKSEATLPTSAISMPQQPSEDIERSKSSIPHPPAQAKRDVRSQVPAATVVSQNSSTFPVSGVSLTVPFQPSQAPVQFGIPGPQISVQGVTASSLQMPMALSVGNPSQVHQQVFVSNFQPHGPHPLQAQSMMHQAQTMRFPQQMGHPLGSQFGNSGFGISPQLMQQQAGNFVTPRKSVKIRDPKTREELRLGKESDTSLDAGSLSNVPLQTQPISYGASHQMNFPHMQPNPIFFQNPTSLPLTSTQMGPSSQASGFNYVGGQSSQVLTSVQVKVNPTVGHGGEKAVPSSLSVSSLVGDMSKMTKFSGPAVEFSKIRSEISIQQPKSIPQPAPSVPSSTTTAPSGTPSGNVSIERSDSFKDRLKKPSKKDQRHSGSQQQAKTSHSADISTMNTSREVARAPDEMQFPCPSEFETSTSVFTGSSPGLGTNTSSEEATLDSSETCGDFSASTGEFSSDGHARVPVASAERTDIVLVGECPDSETSNESNTKTDFDILKGAIYAKQDGFSPSNTQLKEGIAEERIGPSEQLQLDLNLNDDVNVPADSFSLDSSRVNDHTEDLNSEEATFCNEHNGGIENEMIDNHHLSAKACSEKGLISEALTNGSDCTDGQEASVLVSEAMHPDTVPIKNPLVSETVSEVNEKVSEKANADLVLDPEPGLKDKATLELNSVKVNPATSKKKRREFLQKANAAGLTSDLYMAYKGPEEKTQLSISSESVDSSSNISAMPVSSSSNEEDVASKEDGKSKTEPDDWEDAADISNPNLEISDDMEDVHCGLRHSEGDDNGVACRKYSRDFLLTLSSQCSDLPAGFEIANDVVEDLMGSKASISKVVELNRITDRPSGVSRQDYRGNGMVVDDRWIKSPGPFAFAVDPRVDIGQGGNSFGFWVGQGGNQGGLRNLRGQTPAQYVGGYLPVPLIPLASPGGIQRGGADADRWQRASGYQKGLIPSPQSPLQIMHKAAKKYELRQVTDVEEAKQRRLKAILNKLTPQNFDRLFEQVKEVDIDNAVTLAGVISQIFDKALTEPTFCEMYANFCYHLANELPDFIEDNEKINFKRLLLNKCQEEFERGEREQAEADRVEGDGEVNQSKEEREEKRTRTRRRMLGNIRLIGELYKKKMLTEKIMHECIKKLLGEYQNPDEEDIEALCKLMSTIGERIDQQKAKEHMDAYFNIMANLSNNMNLSSRMRFMLRDAIDLRLNRWQQRRKIEGPKKIEELHRDAAQERQAHVSRLTRGPSFGSSARRGQPPDFGHRGSTLLPSPSTQMGAFRGMPSQVRGFGTQDIRTDIRTLLGPIPHRPIDDNAITLGPQGGLARGMSVRGQPIISGASLSDISSGHGESTRVPGGPNGYNSSESEWTSHHTRQEPMSRYVQDRFTRPVAYEHSNPQEHSGHYGNRDLTYADRAFDRSRPVSPATQMQISSVVTPNSSSGKVWPEERLRDMSMAAIREFYSARDENEVTLCIRDLNSPSFHPSMISIWVNDSFERKDRDRCLLAGLLVNLTKNRNSMLSPVQLIKGFESVLATLEDTVTDAPKAAEFLGHIIGGVIMENVVPLGEIGKLIRQGGEEPGRLLQIGLGYKVLQSAFETIRVEKGQSVLDDICKSSNLQLADFRYPVAGK